MELRDYQEEAIASVLDYEAKGLTRQLVVLPTGAGKTVVFASLPKRRPNSLPMLVLAHREELLTQAKEKIETVNPGIVVELEQASNKATLAADVVVASVPTLGRTGSKRIEKFPRDHFKVVIVDEAHHAAAPTYNNVLNYFSPAALRLGFTATPQRGDHVRLTDVFDEIVYYKTIQDLIEANWLSPLVGWRYETDVDLSSIRVVRGDYAEAELARAVNVDARNEAIVTAYKELGAGRKCLVFCVDVSHTTAVAQHFRRNGIAADSVVGSLSSDERSLILSAFKNDSLDVIANCMVLTEGFDDPSVSMIIMARPTQSQLLYTQCVGRGTRLADGKPDCVVIDIADTTRKNKPMGLPTLMGLPPEFDLQGEDLIEAAKKFKDLEAKAPVEVAKVASLDDIDAAWERIDLFAMPEPNPALLEFSNLIWLEAGPQNYYLGLSVKESMHIVQDALGRWTITHKTDTETNPLGTVDDVQEAFSLADTFVRQHRGDQLVLLRQDAAWRNDPPTEKQIKYLKRHGVPITEDLTKGHASYILDRLFAANPKKARPQWLENKIAQDRARKGIF